MWYRSKDRPRPMPGREHVSVGVLFASASKALPVAKGTICFCFLTTTWHAFPRRRRNDDDGSKTRMAGTARGCRLHNRRPTLRGAMDCSRAEGWHANALRVISGHQLHVVRKTAGCALHPNRMIGLETIAQLFQRLTRERFQNSGIIPGSPKM